MAPKGPVYTEEIPGLLYSAPSSRPIHSLHGIEFRFGPGILFAVLEPLSGRNLLLLSREGVEGRPLLRGTGVPLPAQPHFIQGI